MTCDSPRRRRFHLRAFGALAILAGATVARAALPPPAHILDDLRRANGWFMRAVPDPAPDIVKGRWPSSIWTRAVYFEGLMALYGVDRDPRFLQYAVTWGESHQWSPRGSVHTRNADDQCCGQTYLELYELDPRPERIRAISACIDAMAAGPRRDDWSWIDALQMAMPVYARLGRITGNPDYFVRLHEWYAATRDGIAGRPALFNSRDGLWWRDRTFVPPYQTPNGRPCYWSRGNGWVMAALVRTLDAMPPTAPFRSDYVTMLQAMAPAVKAVQRPDGFWNPSLADPADCGGPELTGTALFTYALAWGIRHGVLSAGLYRPTVDRAWTALATQALHPDGFLGYVQGTGKQPADGGPITYEHRPNFIDFGTGCFLLAGAEVYRLAGAERK
jgi:rhamnogalacturonyl hydrolase YesR